MSWYEIVAGAIVIFVSIFLIIVVLLQETKQTMSGAITGMADDSYGNLKNSRDAMLARITKVVAIIFFILAIAINLVAIFLK